MTAYRAIIRFLRPEETGRKHLYYYSGYRPMILFPGAREYRDCQLLFEDNEPKAAGCTHEVKLIPFVPEVWKGVADPGRTFQIFEGPHLVGDGALHPGKTMICEVGGT